MKASGITPASELGFLLGRNENGQQRVSWAMGPHPESTEMPGDALSQGGHGVLQGSPAGRGAPGPMHTRVPGALHGAEV